jgi:hypothetical protein
MRRHGKQNNGSCPVCTLGRQAVQHLVACVAGVSAVSHFPSHVYFAPHMYSATGGTTYLHAFLLLYPADAGLLSSCLRESVDML